MSRSDRMHLENALQWRSTWALMWPVMLANLSLPLLGLADTAVLGHLEESVYLAGVALGASLMAFVFWGFNFLAMGLSGFTSQAYGARNSRRIRTQLMQYSLVALVLVSLVLAAHRPLIEAGLAFMSASDAVTLEARRYLHIRAWGIPAQIFNTMLLGFFVGLQNTRISLYTVSLAQMVNLVLNVVLVYGFGMTTDGIALGTVMSEYLALTLVLIMLRRSLKRLSPGVYWPRLSSLRAYGAIFSVSFSLFLRTFVLLAGFAWFNRLSAQLGDTLLAANAMLLVFLTLISNTLDGSAAAAEAQVGMAVGQRQPKRLRAALWTTGWAAVALISALALFFAGLGGVIIQGLTSQPELAATALQYRYWVIALPLLGGIAFWLDGVFIGARRTADMRNGVIAGFAVFWLASHQWSHTNHGLWVSFLLLFATRSGWMLWIFWRHVLPMARLPHSRT